MSYSENQSNHAILYSTLNSVFGHVAKITRDGDVLCSHVGCDATRQVFHGVSSVFTAVNRKDKDVLRKLISEAFSSQERLSKGLVRYVDTDHTSYWLEVAISVPDGEEEAIFMANDVTDYVRLKSFSEIVEETVLIGNWELEFTGSRALFLSPNVKRIFGIPQEKNVSTLGELSNFFPSDQKAQLLAASDELMATGNSFNLTLEVKGWENREKYVQVFADAKYVDGVVSRIFGTCRDVTEQILKEKALGREKEKAEAASRTKSQFLANMSHEIRTPLNGIIGVASLLEATPMNDEQGELLELIQESGDLLLSVLNDILDLSKVESGHMELEAAPFKVSTLVSRLEGLYKMKAKEKGIHLHVDVQCNEMIERVGDANRILQVLHNILSNALKFTEKGRVILRVHDFENKPLHISIADTGIGMTKDQTSRLFEPFMQADYSTTRKYGGTGLGMAIAKKMVEAMQGELLVTSKEGFGTEVSLNIPLATVNAANTQPRAESLKLEDFRGCRALVAEDNKANQVVISAMLRKLGVEAHIVPDGRQAVEASRNGQYDILILDYSMPVMNGVEALHAIRETELSAHGRGTLAVICTANTMSFQVEEYLREGFDVHLAKPLTLKAIKRVLALACKRRDELPLIDTAS